MYNALTLTGKSLLLKEFSFYVNVIILLNKILKIKKKAFECWMKKINLHLFNSIQ